VLALALVAAPGAASAWGSSSSWSSGSSHKSSSSKSYRSGHLYTHHKASGVERDSRGHIKRDPEQRRAFMRTHPCPSTGKTHGACPGYQVDHRQALACGGADDPSNMQWLTVEEHHAKHAHGAGCEVW